MGPAVSRWRPAPGDTRRVAAALASGAIRDILLNHARATWRCLLSSIDAPCLFGSLSKRYRARRGCTLLVTSKRGDLLSLGLGSAVELAPEMRA
jgi:hypothetical protein